MRKPWLIDLSGELCNSTEAKRRTVATQMHGRVKKDVVEPSPEEKEKQREQVRKARGLFGNLLEMRQKKAYSEEALDMTSKALQFHPEFPTLWGYRRELLTSGKISKAPFRELLEVEMKLLEKADG